MFSKFSVQKPLTIAVGVIIVFVLGVVSFLNMNTDLLPNIDLPYVVVNTSFPGATPEKIEASITKPLEQALSTTSGLKNISSTSKENSSTIILEFNQDVNVDSVIIDMNSKIDMVEPYLDENASSPMLMKLNPDMMPIMMLSVDMEDLDIKEVSTYVEEKILPEFERIEGVASVTSSGLIQEFLRVDLDKDKIEEINNKILNNIESEFSSQEKDLDNQKREIQNSINSLNKEDKTQTQNLNNALSQINKGIKDLEVAVDKIGKTKEELKSDISSAQNGLKEVESQISMLQESINALPDGEDKDIALEKLGVLNSTKAKISEGISLAQQGIKAIDSLNDLKSKKKELEKSKSALSSQMKSAKNQLNSAKSQIEDGKKQLSDAKDTAKKGANIKEKITPDMISNILLAENFSMPAGYISEGEEKYSIRVGDKFESVQEIEDLLLFNVDIDGVGEVTVKDVANVYMSDNSSETYTNINGNKGIILNFQKSSTHSTSEVSKSVNKTILELNNKNGVHITTLMDQGIYIKMIINSVFTNLIYGGLLSIVILFVFLKSFRPTLIVSFSIPISLLFAIVLMYFSGMSLNMISLSGLALGVGMLVDNSIVVIENIYRLRNQGLSVAKASVYGAKQVSGAIFASTLTTVCVFLPIVFTEGLTKQVFSDMGLTIGYALFASLIIALTLVPAMSSKLLTTVNTKENKIFDKLVSVYEKVLIKSLNHKAIVLIFALGMLIFSLYSATKMGIEFLPSMDSPQMSVTMTLPEGTTRDDILSTSDEFIKRVKGIDGIETVGALESTGNDMMSISSNVDMSFYIVLKEGSSLSNKEIEGLIKNKTKDLNAQIDVISSNMDMSALGGSGVQIIVKGADLDKLSEISSDLSEKISKIDGTKNVSNGLEESNSELRIIVDKNKAMSYGLTVAQVYQEVSKAIELEKSSTTVTLDGYDYSTVIGNPNKLSIETIGDYLLKGSKDGEDVDVSLNEIATIENSKGMSSINRDNQSRYITVTAEVKSGYNIGLIGKEVNKLVDSYKVPSGYTLEIAGESENIAKSIRDMILMGTMAILFIYLIMVSQFQSLLSPFIVMFTIPLAFTGGFLALLITGTNISMISMLGFLVLSGVIVNNGIVFVDYINQLRLDGMDKREAIIETGRTRIRPILMTALTTILAMSTMAMGVGMGAEMNQGLAIVTIGGLIYSTLLTLLVVPVLYDLFNRKPMKKIEIEVL